MKVLNNGAWDNMTQTEVTSEHAFDEKLCTELISYLIDEKAETVVDMGCGIGEYVRRFKNHFKCDGFDGNPHTRELTNNICNVLDLSEPVNINNSYDWVVSLEVGEHIPKKFEDFFIDNITKCCTNGLIISWAIPGQGGKGHVNEKKNDYIIQRITSKGFTYLPEKSKNLRNASQLWWFKNTIMVFKKNN